MRGRREPGEGKHCADPTHISVMYPEVQHPPQPHILLPYKHSLPAMLHQAIFLQWDLLGIDDIIQIFSIKQEGFASSHLEALDLCWKVP